MGSGAELSLRVSASKTIQEALEQAQFSRQKEILYS